jgi:Protein of unknown function (DUF3037)
VAERDPFQYAILRVVPDAQRGECLNAGVVLFCRRRSFLAIECALDAGRLSAFAPGLDHGAIAQLLDGLRRDAAGDPSAGPLAALPPSERLGWLTAPHSTVVQASPVHTGLCEDPAETLGRLTRELVATRD